MNPLEWSGPTFLLFYAGLGALVCGALVVARRVVEGGAAPRLEDACAIAYLRGGAPEALRVAVATLIGRGALKVEAGEQLVAEPVAERLRPLDEALLQHFAGPRPATSIFRDDGLRQRADELRPGLERQRLLAGVEIRSGRRARFLLALGLLWLVAGVKVGWALSHGHGNVGFLVGLAAVFAAAAWAAAGRGRRTRRGDVALADLQQLLAGQRTRAAIAGRGTGLAEAALLAGVFGVAAFPLSAEPGSLFRRSTSDSATASSGCGGESCGSSCGSSDGGGDSGGDSGGGGDGGSGCGGCGGGGD